MYFRLPPSTPPPVFRDRRQSGLGCTQINSSECKPAALPRPCNLPTGRHRISRDLLFFTFFIISLPGLNRCLRFIFFLFCSPSRFLTVFSPPLFLPAAASWPEGKMCPYLLLNGRRIYYLTEGRHRGPIPRCLQSFRSISPVCVCPRCPPCQQTPSAPRVPLTQSRHPQHVKRGYVIFFFVSRCVCVRACVYVSYPGSAQNMKRCPAGFPRKTF